jgi:hypothetical protein
VIRSRRAGVLCFGGLWSSGNAFSGVMNSPSGSPMAESRRRLTVEKADARRMLPARMHSVHCKVWWSRNNGLGLFFMLWARPLSSSEGKSYATEYNYVLDDSVLPTL